MSQIRRQPRRKSKKSGLKTIKNPFNSCLSYLPPSMAKKVKELDRVIIRHLEDYLTEPSEDVN
jgi:hypothetical protein